METRKLRERIKDRMMEGSESFTSTRERFIPEQDYEQFLNAIMSDIKEFTQPTPSHPL